MPKATSFSNLHKVSRYHSALLTKISLQTVYTPKNLIPCIILFSEENRNTAVVNHVLCWWTKDWF